MLSDDSMERAVVKRQTEGIGKGKLSGGRLAAGHGRCLAIHVQPDD